MVSVDRDELTAVTADPQHVDDRPDTTWRARRSRLLSPLVAAGGVLLATGYVAMVNPNQPGHYPLCPFKAITGWDCPGCGGLRAVHDLAHGNLAAAVDQNALVVVLLIPVAVVMWLGWVRRAWSGKARPVRKASTSRLGAAWARGSPYAVLALLIAFTVFRNLPVGHYFHSGLS